MHRRAGYGAVIQAEGMPVLVAGHPLKIPRVRPSSESPVGGVVPDPRVLVETNAPAITNGNLRIGLDEHGTRDLGDDVSVGLALHGGQPRVEGVEIGPA